MITLRINIVIINIIIPLILFSGCKDPKVEAKIDATLKTELIKLKKMSKVEQQIIVLFKVNEDLTELHHLVLEKKGVKIGANIGNIYTATLPAKSVYSVAKLRFIDYIQGQKKFEVHPADSNSVNKL